MSQKAESSRVPLFSRASKTQGTVLGDFKSKMSIKNLYKSFVKSVSKRSKTSLKASKKTLKPEYVRITLNGEDYDIPLKSIILSGKIDETRNVYGELTMTGNFISNMVHDTKTPLIDFNDNNLVKDYSLFKYIVGYLQLFNDLQEPIEKDILFSRFDKTINKNITINQLIKLLEMTDALLMTALFDHLIDVFSNNVYKLNIIDQTNFDKSFDKKISTKTNYKKLDLKAIKWLDDYLQNMGLPLQLISPIYLRIIDPILLVQECENNTDLLDICQIYKQPIAKNVFDKFNFNVNDFVTSKYTPDDVLYVLLDEILKDGLQATLEMVQSGSSIVLRHAYKYDNFEMFIYLMTSKYKEKLRDYNVFRMIDSSIDYGSLKIMHYLFDCIKERSGKVSSYYLFLILKKIAESEETKNDKKIIKLALEKCEPLTYYQTYNLFNSIDIDGLKNILNSAKKEYPNHEEWINTIYSNDPKFDPELLYQNFMQTYSITENETKELKNRNGFEEKVKYIRRMNVGIPFEVTNYVTLCEYDNNKYSYIYAKRD